MQHYICFDEFTIYVLTFVRIKFSTSISPESPPPVSVPLMQCLGRQPPLLTGQVKTWLQMHGDSLSVSTAYKYMAFLALCVKQHILVT